MKFEILAKIWGLWAILASDHALAWKNWTKEGINPDGRKGHSLLMFGNKVVMFGGKGEDMNRFHLPKTFELVDNDGMLEFASYDQLAVPKGSRVQIPVVENDAFIEECIAKIDTDPEAVKNDPKCEFNGTREDIHFEENYIPVAPFYNDVWWYNLDCDRFADDPCETENWHVVDPGAVLGGCMLDDGHEICSHPYERFGHSAQIINDQVLVIFGGFSPMCGDFCDDAWFFVLPQLPHESLADVVPGSRWVRLEPLQTPGNRWKSASVLIASAKIAMFGGHRLWHGFATDNFRENNYANTDQYPFGGYLNDLWTWDLTDCLYGPEVPLHSISLDVRLAFYKRCKEPWKVIEAKKNCTRPSLLENGEVRPGYTWEQRNDILCFTVWPKGRSGHGLVYKNNKLYLFGGYHTYFPYPSSTSAGAGVGSTASNNGNKYRPYPNYDFFLGDFWEYDINSGYWFEVTLKSKRKPSGRREHSFLTTKDDILVLFGGYQSNYYIDDFWYFNLTSQRWLEKTKFVHPIYPENCTGGAQILANPTRGTVLDGKFGRSSTEIFVNVTRRQAPGWDGCRDRADGRVDLPWNLQWSRPTQRSSQAVAYSPYYENMLLFGGIGFQKETLERTDTSFEVHIRTDLWQYRMHQCISNCSGHGDCSYGFCHCHSGFYGLDCSNTSCPGDFCYYDENTNEQVCKHCCHAPYVHTDNDVYIPNYGKQSCSLEQPGHSNGICDGYGHCLCAPPFIGLDCAIKDCPNKCSGNGWCSEEYPVSRCMCNPGFTGSSCERKECLNNCSYPNGICDTSTGTCTCAMWPNPYNRSRTWRRFEVLVTLNHAHHWQAAL